MEIFWPTGLPEESNIRPIKPDNERSLFPKFQITKKAFKLRSNFTVKTKFLGQEVASIDAKWGGKFEIKVFDEDLANNAHFLDFLILFTGTIKFHGEIED